MSAGDTNADVLDTGGRGGRMLWWLIGILVLAAALRLPELGRRGFLLDEAWTAEVVSGRGSLHQHLLLGIVFHPPELYSLANAPPWWRVWSNIQMTHPPLYYVLLRLWINCLGEGDGTERMLSVLFSLAAVGLVFDASRLLNGPTVAIWAGLLMALAPPQIEYARQARNYAMELATALAAADALIRIETLGINWRRIAGLSLATLAALLTHYFCVGFLGALGVYALLRLRGRARRAGIAAFFAAAVAFAFCWGPFMWEQRKLFSTSDPSTTFLQEHDPAHTLRSLHRALLMPFEMLAQPQWGSASALGGSAGSSAANPEVSAPLARLALLACVLYVAPLLLLRHRPGLLLWWLCLCGTVGLVLAMDLGRGTRQLAFIRYVLLAGPAVFVLIPACAAAAKSAWVRHGLPALAVAIAIAAIDQGYPTTVTDPHRVVADLQPLAGPRDFLLFIGAGQQRWDAEGHFLVLERYLRPMPTWMALVDGFPPPAVMKQAMASRRTIAYTQTEDPRLFVPGLEPIAFHSYYGRGQVWVLASRAAPHKQ
jgi:hypothetical protein